MTKLPQFHDYFDPIQINGIEHAIERAWDVISHTDDISVPQEARSLLALCVMAEARNGEVNHVALVNRAIVRFRAQRAKAALANHA